MKIRRYREPDYDEVWRLHNLALESVGAHPGNGLWDDDLHHIGEEYLHSGGEFLVGIHQGRLVAMGALKPSSAERAEIMRMRVHPEFQRCGFGRAILERLEAKAVQLEYKTLHLYTTVQQVAAQSLYAQRGYMEVGRAKFGPFDVILYEKTLEARSP